MKSTIFSKPSTWAFLLIAQFQFFSITFSQNPQWIVYNTGSGLASNFVTSVAHDNEGNTWFGTYGAGLSKFNGISWATYTTLHGLPSDTIFSITVDQLDTLWIGTQGGLSKWYKSIFIRNYTTLDGLSGNNIQKVMIDDANKVWCGTNWGISKYDGSTWTNWYDGHYFISMAFEQNGNRWFGTNWSNNAGGYQGGLYKYGTSMNLINRYTDTITSGGLPNNTVSGIAIDNSGLKWLATFGGAVNFDDTHWSDVPCLADTICHDVAIDKKGIIWFGTRYNGAIKYAGSICSTYNTSNSPLPVNTVVRIFIDSSNNKWFCTMGGGVVVFNEDGVVAVDDKNNTAVPIKFDLLANYPNPFNPSTLIRYEIPTQCHVTLKLFDVLGTEIETLVNEYETPNQYQVRWNPINLPSGVYFYRLQAGTFSKTQKLILVR